MALDSLQSRTFSRIPAFTRKKPKIVRARPCRSPVDGLPWFRRCVSGGAEMKIHQGALPRAARYGLAVALLAAAAGELSSENVTLTTYYPAPSGVYTKMIVSGDAFLARDGGAVLVGTSTAPGAGTK